VDELYFLPSLMTKKLSVKGIVAPLGICVYMCVEGIGAV